MGNPTLFTELATGLNIAFENYLPAGGLISVGVFYRQVNDLIRNVTSLQTVSLRLALRAGFRHRPTSPGPLLGGLSSKSRAAPVNFYRVW